MSTLIADRYFPESVSSAPRRSKKGIIRRILRAMQDSRMAEAERTIHRYYASKSDAELRAWGVPEATIAHVRKYYV